MEEKGLHDLFVELPNEGYYFKDIKIYVDLEVDNEHIVMEILAEDYKTIKITMPIQALEKLKDEVDRAIKYLRENW